MHRHYSPLDKILIQLDAGINTVFANSSSRRANPAADTTETPLSPEERGHSAALMRVNHSGEVCAQALYRGQLVFAKNPETRDTLQHACLEESDHLSWCHDRLKELQSHRSYLNFFWYWQSFMLGALASLWGDRWSLGFVEETEIQVEQHLQGHMNKLSSADHKSRLIVEQMQKDEAHHGQAAHRAGGTALPQAIRSLMKGCAGIMTRLSYFI